MLQKDVSEAYKTANEILKVEEAMDKSRTKLNNNKRKKHKIGK